MVSIVKKLAIIIALMSIIACAHKRPEATTMRVCDASGCADRPKNYATFDTDSTPSPEDEKIAALEKLAASDPRAAYDLALRFFRGDGVRQDSYKSIKWMRDAGEKGHLEAQKALGRVYLTGLGEMGADYAEAQRWLSISTSRGDKEGEELLREATEARKSELEDYRWLNRWRPIFYNYWYSGYRYNWYWGTNNWYLY